MSSHTPFDLGRARKTAAIAAASAGIYIDWGPDLPSRYPGGRARVLVANPTTLFIGWETDRGTPERWIVHLEVFGGAAQTLEVPSKSPDVWAQVPAGSRGLVHLARIEADGAREEVAVLPFRTPPNGPSWRTDERWGRLQADGLMEADVPPPRGGRVAVEDPVGFVAVGYERPADDEGGATSSTVAPSREE